MENKKIEIKDIPGFEGRYKATSDGRILNAKTGLPVKPDLNQHGYLKLKLYRSKEETKKQTTVHRIIALTFLGESILEVNHKDGNKLNNNIENLEYVTKKENMKHAFENGLNLSYKLTDEIVLKIKERYLEGDRLVDISKDFSITPTAIRKRLMSVGIIFKKNNQNKDGKAKKRENLESKIYKIHPAKYPEIEKLFFENKIVQAEIAKIYNVSIGTIKSIVRELKQNR